MCIRLLSNVSKVKIWCHFYPGLLTGNLLGKQWTTVRNCEMCTPSWFLLHAAICLSPLIGKFVNSGGTNWLTRLKVLTWIHYTKCLCDLRGLQSSRTNLAHFHCTYWPLKASWAFYYTYGRKQSRLFSDSKLKLLSQHFYSTIFISVAVNFRAFMKTLFNSKMLFRLH